MLYALLQPSSQDQRYDMHMPPKASRSFWFLVGFVGLLLALAFIWPNRYRYQGVGDNLERIDRLNGCSWQVSYEGEWQSKDRRNLCKTDYDRKMDVKIEEMQKGQAESNAREKLARDGLLSKISDITMQNSNGNLVTVRFHNSSNCIINAITISIFSKNTKISRTYRATTFVDGLSNGSALFEINKNRDYYNDDFTWSFDSIGIYDAPNVICAQVNE